MGDGGARGLRKAFIVLSALVLVGLWPAAAFATGPLDLAAPDVADAVEDTTKTAAKVVEQVPELADQAAGTVVQVGEQAVETVDEVTNDAGGAVDKVVEDATGAVDEAVDGATGAADKAVDGATGAVNEATKDKGGSGDQVAGAVDKGAQDATGAAKQATGGKSGSGAPADSLGGSGNGARQARPDSSGRSRDGMVKARSTRRAGGRDRQQSRNRAREEQPGRPDPLLGLIEAGNEIGDQVEASASGGQPATQGSGLPFTGGVALFVALAYASLFCGVGSALLAGTRSRGPSEFRLLS